MLFVCASCHGTSYRVHWLGMADVQVFDEDKSGTIEFKVGDVMSQLTGQEFICALSVTSRGRLDEKLKCK